MHQKKSQRTHRKTNQRTTLVTPKHQASKSRTHMRGPQYSPDSEGEGINVRTIRMGLMSVIDHNDTNYKIKLAVACQLENTMDEKVAEALVEAPKKDALGKYTKAPKRKG